MLYELWHGTNQAFEKFSMEMGGAANDNAASRAAIFFSAGQPTAWCYAHHAAKMLLPDQPQHYQQMEALLDRYQRALDGGDHALSERLVEKMEQLEQEAKRPRPELARILRCEVRLDNPLIVDGRDWSVASDMAAVLVRAREAGHDGVIFKDMWDVPTGEPITDDHVAIFSPENAIIVEAISAAQPSVEVEEFEPA